MKLPYKTYVGDILRPVIPIKVSYGGIFVPCEVLVDSGADICIFDAEIAEILEIKLELGEKRSISGITGANDFYYLHEVNLSVGKFSYKTNVGFLPNIARMGYGVAGQKGFFDHFVIKFNYKNAEIDIKEHKK